ncbi:MAG: rod shape-determining protein MreC [Clostridia bacterium]|nr:rod shape-determining protein MreC [Clostridia bacterium]
MARFHLRPREEKKKERPAVSDDFIYDEPEEDSSSAIASDTPEEALKKLRGGSEKTVVSEKDPEESEKTVESMQAFRKKARAASTVLLDDDLQPLPSRRKSRGSHPRLRIFFLSLVTVILVLLAAAYIFHRIIPDVPLLGEPETAVSEAVSPVQEFFSSITETVAGLFRSYKLRSNIEAEYNALRAENEQLVYKAMLADELQQTLSQYEDLSDEIAANAGMKPIVCTVIGKSDSNYFSTFTINKGTNDGVEDYMAVTISGALVGYTESVEPSSATVRTIIDSEASIAAMISSSRDQGTVRGTLGIDGTAMCRMYYLPDDNLPRPGDTVVTSGVGMSFPKGIPIGTVRESTRGMDANKQYIVLEPLADFQHLEYVIVLRYRPVAEAIQGRENGRTSMELVPLESARPSPQVPQIASSLFESQTTPDPNATPTPTPEPTETPEPTPEPTPIPTPTPEIHNLEYTVVNPRGEPTPTLTPTPVPTPTPYLTPDPDTMTFEEDEE